MSGGSWRSYGAAGGWLAVALVAAFVCAVSARSQGAGEPQSSERVAPSSPAEQSGAQGQEDNGEGSPATLALPVRIVDDPKESDRAREQQQRTEEHDAKDLIAQERAADAATRSADQSNIQTDYILAQTIIAGIGTIALIVTLILVKKQADAADAANKLYVDTTERQIRPYFVFVEGSVTFKHTGSLWAHDATIKFRNSGATPASISLISVQSFMYYEEKHVGGTGSLSRKQQVVGPQIDYFIKSEGAVGNRDTAQFKRLRCRLLIGILCRYSGNSGKEWDEETWLGATTFLQEQSVTCELQQQQKPKSKDGEYALLYLGQ